MLKLGFVTIQRRTVLLALLALAFPLVQSGAVFAQKVSSSVSPVTITEGSPRQIQLQLDAPIICPMGALTCEVDVTFSTTDPSHISFSPATTTWQSTDWFQVRTVTINSTADGIYNSGESLTAHATVVSNAAYYSGFTINIGLNVVNTDPIPPIPGVVDKAITVNANSTVTTDVLSGITGNPDSSTLSITSPPSHGTAVDPPGTITYTPNNGFSGADSLTYQVCSQFGPSVCGTAHLNFNVIQAAVVSVGVPNTGDGSYHSSSSWLIFVSVGFLAAGTCIAVSARRKYH